VVDFLDVQEDGVTCSGEFSLQYLIFFLLAFWSSPPRNNYGLYLLHAVLLVPFFEVLFQRFGAKREFHFRMLPTRNIFPFTFQTFSPMAYFPSLKSLLTKAIHFHPFGSYEGGNGGSGHGFRRNRVF